MTDLATLRELPQRDTFVQQNNAIYGVGAGDCDLAQELALLPHIRYEDLRMTKFLGRGAFGEVYEGNIKQLPESNHQQSISSRVAVKTLRKGASEQEKNEFLKEAILMSHFKHKHIIRLLGVCLDADPNVILLELMEGGDLLSFLRNNRPSLSRTLPQHSTSFCQQLSLLDLVSMCVDVAKGCCYLEELHYVHRDLAARNCLVSSLDPRLRVVKIGDFGLARDIYHNDYYRKEGEGLLPVRYIYIYIACSACTYYIFINDQEIVNQWNTRLFQVDGSRVIGWRGFHQPKRCMVFRGSPLGNSFSGSATLSSAYQYRSSTFRYFRWSLGSVTQLSRFIVSYFFLWLKKKRDQFKKTLLINLKCRFDLMMSCWSYDPSARPIFTQCLSELLNLQEKLKNSTFTAVHNGHYIGTVTHRKCLFFLKFYVK